MSMVKAVLEIAVLRQGVKPGHTDKQHAAFTQRSGELSQQTQRVDNMLQHVIENDKLE